MTTYAYLRVSTQIQANEGQSLDAQERQLQGWAMMHNRTIDCVMREEAVSGSVPVTKRPEGGRMFAALRSGDTVVASKLDRLFRSALDALQTVETLQKRGVNLILLDLGGDVVSNGLSKLFLTIAAAFAEAERDRIRERISLAKSDARKRGRYLGGKVPYGFRVERGELVPIAEQQTVIEAIRDLRAAEKPLRSIRQTIQQQFGQKLSLDAISRIAS